MAKVSLQHVSCSVPPTPVLSQQLLRGSRDKPLLYVPTRYKKSEFHNRRGGAINCSCAKSSPCAYPLPPLVFGKSRSLNPQFKGHSHKQRKRHLGRATPDFDGFDTSEMFAANQKAPEEEERGGIQIGAESLPNLVPEDMDEITDEMRAVQPPGLCFTSGVFVLVTSLIGQPGKRVDNLHIGRLHPASLPLQISLTIIYCGQRNRLRRYNILCLSVLYVLIHAIAQSQT